MVAADRVAADLVADAKADAMAPVRSARPSSVGPDPSSVAPDTAVNLPVTACVSAA
jgi:hypothetical protein